MFVCFVCHGAYLVKARQCWFDNIQSVRFMFFFVFFTVLLNNARVLNNDMLSCSATIENSLITLVLVYKNCSINRGRHIFLVNNVRYLKPFIFFCMNWWKWYCLEPGISPWLSRLWCCMGVLRRLFCVLQIFCKSAFSNAKPRKTHQCHS